ncbi:MAG: hypothetical protein ACHWZW_20630 [Spirulina sp.]
MAEDISTATLTVDCESWLRDVGGQLPGGSTLVEQLLKLLSDAGMPTTITLSIPFPNIPSTESEAASVDPIRVIAMLTNAITQAEETLTPQNMEIAGGQIDSMFNVTDGIGGIASAHLILKIVPKTYS